MIAQDFIRNLIFFQIVVMVVVCSNIWMLHRTRRHAAPRTLPSVSVLVPARDEEQRIGRCVESLLAQDYPNFEVLVYDDHSCDGTLAILQKLAAHYPRLTILSGADGPGNQGGKPYACAQMAERAAGELLFFTDADTVHAPAMLQQTVTALVGQQADLLTGFPRQQVRSWGEKLLVPFFGWACTCFVPLWLAYRLRLPALSCAVGQMLLFRRAAYDAIGGHAGMPGEIVEDLALARKTKAAGLRWRMAHVADLITCRMYSTTSESINGFTKNLFAAFGFRLLPFLFAVGWLLVLFWAPLVVLPFWITSSTDNGALWRLLLCAGLSLPLWWIPYRELGLPSWLALLYPATILANALVGLRSLLHSVTGKLTWKDRRLPPPQWRWL